MTELTGTASSRGSTKRSGAPEDCVFGVSYGFIDSNYLRSTAICCWWKYTLSSFSTSIQNIKLAMRLNGSCCQGTHSATCYTSSVSLSPEIVLWAIYFTINICYNGFRMKELLVLKKYSS